MVNQQFANAVHILTALACKSDDLQNSEMLAKSVNTNPVVIRRLLSHLTKAKLVITVRGKSGGVRIGRLPSEITLKDIYLALPMCDTIAVRKKGPEKTCQVSCSMQNILSHVSEGVQKSTLKFLETQKLSDICKKVSYS